MKKRQGGAIIGEYYISESNFDNPIGQGAFSVACQCWKFVMSKKGEPIPQEGAQKFVVKLDKKKKSFSCTMNELEVTTLLKENPHNNLLKVECIIPEASGAYIIVSYCNHGVLDKYIKNKYFLPEYEAQGFAKDIAQGISHLHSLKAYHKDIKPENIYLNRTEGGNIAAIIGDFGLSTLEENGISAPQAGSPAYMAPELQENDYYGKEVDIWAFGVTLYEMCFGRRPFSELKVAESVVKGEYAIPQCFFLSLELLQVIELCLQRKKEDRISASDLVLTDFLTKPFEELTFIYTKGAIDMSTKKKDIKDRYTKGKLEIDKLTANT